MRALWLFAVPFAQQSAIRQASSCKYCTATLLPLRCAMSAPKPDVEKKSAIIIVKAEPIHLPVHNSQPLQPLGGDSELHVHSPKCRLNL